MRDTKRRLAIPAFAAIVAAASAACSATTDRILDLDAEGTVFVFLYRDDNLNAAYNSAVDIVLKGARVDLRLAGAINRQPGGDTDTLGVRTFRVPVGRYVVEVDQTLLGDTLEVQAGAGAFTVGAGDSILVPVAVGFPTITITEARALPLGEARWVRGIVMNSPNVFGDSTFHIVDDSSAIRVTHARPNLPMLPGDSALILGRRTMRDGQPTLELQVVPVVPGIVNPPPPDSIGTGTAATAGGGALDARFVRVTNAALTDTATVDGFFVLTLNDGSGDLHVVQDPNVFSVGGNQPLRVYVPGSTSWTINGMLVPNPLNNSEWRLKPRQRSDITLVPPPT
jgi:hypothetical protein